MTSASEELGVSSVAERAPTVATAVRIIRIASWVLLALGILASINLSPPLAVAAAACGASFAVAATVVRVENLPSRSIPSQVLFLGSSILTIAAVTLTGGVESPYVVLAMMPGLLAAMTGGYRAGLTTALLSASLLGSITVTSTGVDGLINSGGIIGLFPLLALLVAQIRSLMIEAMSRATTLEAATAEAEAELVRMSQANDLLRRLTDVYAKGSSNPVDVGRSAIEAIIETQAGSFATATLFDSQGPVVVARAGTDSPQFVRTQFPLGDGDTTSGVVSIGTAEPLSPRQSAEIERLLRPVAVSFANAVLLQDIAGEAVREERLRVARELHDEVGPALAALGYSLDGVAGQTSMPEVRDEVAHIRGALGLVVDDLRGIIADLRSYESGSLIQDLTSALSVIDGQPRVRIEISERRPPRSTAGRQIVAIVTEAVRNAHQHADASVITVNGFADRDGVNIAISDDGRGFDPVQLPEGHYGVMGMRERADRIGATVDIQSSSSGTTVRVVWKEKR